MLCNIMTKQHALNVKTIEKNRVKVKRTRNKITKGCCFL